MPSYVKDKRVYLTLLAGLIIIFLLVAYVGFGATWGAIEHLNPLIFVGIFAFAIVGSLIAAARLRILLRIHGHEVAYPDVYHINVTGVLGNELTPGVHLGGEVLRIFLLGKHGVRPASAVTCALVVKILDVLIIFPLAILLAFLIVLRFLSIPMLLAVMALVFLMCLSVIILLISRGYVYRGVRRILSRIGIREVPAKFHFSKRMGVSLVSMSYARWLIFGVQEYLVIRALGIDLGFTSVLLIFTVSMIVRLVAPLPFGLGITEAITAGLYSHFGAALSEATAAALVTRTYVTLMIVILGAYGGLRIGFNAIRRVARRRLKVSKGKREVG
jgi:uncharacterized membrane protein YbhN (UPF0104 family)